MEKELTIENDLWPFFKKIFRLCFEKETKQNSGSGEERPHDLFTLKKHERPIEK